MTTVPASPSPTRSRRTADLTDKAPQFQSQKQLDDYVWQVCNILRASGAAGAMQYVPELSWLLFLRVLDLKEQEDAERADFLGAEFTPSIDAPYRWRDWAAPGGPKQTEIDHSGADFKAWINDSLLPYLKGLKDVTGATTRQRVISEALSGVERIRIDTSRNIKEVLGKIHHIDPANMTQTHFFPLSQVYEGLLLRMGDKGNDGGQFYTPREVIRALVQVIAPQVGETVYDPCAGTGGFLAESYEFLRPQVESDFTPERQDTLTRRTFYGREKESLVYPITLANLVLHGIEEPHIWHGNTLTGGQTYGGLFASPDQYDIVLTNPPFGGKEGKDAQTNFAYKTNATEVLFVQHILDALKPSGRCGLVMPEGFVFRTNEDAFVKTKRKLLDECDLWCVVSLPGGVFSSAGAGVKTNLLFFTKGKKTERIWYYDLSYLKINKGNPLTLAHFADFFAQLPTRADSERSWTVDFTARRAQAKAQADPLRAQAQELTAEGRALEMRALPLRKSTSQKAEYDELLGQASQRKKEAAQLTAQADNVENAVYDLKAVNPNAPAATQTATPTDLIAQIHAQGVLLTDALARLEAI